MLPSSNRASVPPLRVALIGLGRIMRDDHLPAVLASDRVTLEAVCDPDPGALEHLPAQSVISTYASVEQMLQTKVPEAAIVAVPHDQYLPILEQLANAGVHVLKEKPFATSLDEAKAIDKLIVATGIHFAVTLQRRFNPIFQVFEQMRHHIGRLLYFDFRYTLNVPSLELGWRRKRESAGGGCLIDMGYHTIDLLLWYFGLPATVRARLITGSRVDQDYDVEDTCLLELAYGSPGEIVGHVFLSRVHPRKQEVLTVAGTGGLIELDRFAVRRVAPDGTVVEELQRSGEWPSAYLDQLTTFANDVRAAPGKFPTERYHNHFAHVALIEAAYQSAKEEKAISPKDLLMRSKAKK
jgi:predicted dehydrogenase